MSVTRIQDIPPVTWVDNPEAMMEFVAHVRTTQECALDTETTGIDRSKDSVIIWSACPDKNSRYCFTREMLPIFDEELSQDPNIRWYLTNVTFDFCMLHNSGVRVPVGPAFCTLAMDWLIDENRQGAHGLKETAADYCGLRMEDYKDVFAKKQKGETPGERLLRGLKEDFKHAISYASYDAYATFRVFKKQRYILRHMFSRDGMRLWDYFKAIELPFTRVLYNMIQRGIKVDLPYLQSLEPGMEARIAEIGRQLNRIAEKELNPNSTPQLRWLLFEKLGLIPIKLTDSKQPSTDVEVIKLYAGQGVEACILLAELRKLTKVLGTYVKGLQRWVDKDGRIHPTLTQHVTVTGRLSSIDPNLQNIPRSEEGDVYKLRAAFIPRPGYKLLCFDYEQLEMRLLAHIAQEANMIKLINEGKDIHTGTASLMFGFKYEDIIAAVKKKKKLGIAEAKAKKNEPLTIEEEVLLKEGLTKEEKEMVFARQASKTIGFGLVYGEGPQKLGKTLGVDIERAKELMQMFFDPFPGIADFIRSRKNQARLDFMIETIAGRPRRFPDMESIAGRHELDSNEKMLKAMAERQAVNSEIQGSAADVARQAMIRCEFDETLKQLRAELLLQIHDELIFEVPDENVEEATPIIKDHMENALGYKLAVSLGVDGGSGNSWKEAKG